MPKINKNKKAKKPYEKSSSSSNSKSSSSEAQEPPKETEKGDSSRVLQAECCSQCRDSSHGLLQCECCDLWYCSGCSGISEETMNVIGEVNSLQFFCLPCESEVFKLINKNSASITNQELITCNMTAAITVAIMIKGLQDALQNTLVSAISNQFNRPPNGAMQSSSVEQYVDASQEMVCQSQETEQQNASTSQPKLAGRRQHDEIAEAVSSVLKEEKEKSKRKLNIILHNIPESDADTPEVRKEHDTDSVKAIINQHLSIPASVSNVTQLGKKSDKP